MAFTYRNPARSTTPARTVGGARAIVVGARRYPSSLPSGSSGSDLPEERAAGPTGRVARYAWADHYRPLRESLAVIARHLKTQGHRAVVVVDDNALVDREAAYRAGIGWFGKNANLLLPGGRGSWFVLGGVITTAALPPTRERRARRLRRLSPLPGRLPHRCHRGARRDRRQPLPGVAGPAAGDVPPEVPRGARRPDLRLRRLPGGVPAQPQGGPRRRGARDGRWRARSGPVGAAGRRRCRPVGPLRPLVPGRA